MKYIHVQYFEYDHIPDVIKMLSCLCYRCSKARKIRILEEEKKKLRMEMAAFIYLFEYGESSGRDDRASFPSLTDDTVLPVHVGNYVFAFTTSITIFLHLAWDGKGVR